MIVEFSVANFRSIKEMQTLSMVAAPLVSKYPEMDQNNVIEFSNKLSLLKTKAIYGANGSGKSNIIHALIAFVEIINASVRDDKVLFRRIQPFLLSEDTDSAPTFFQMTFVYNETLYRYGFEATEKNIVSEWLYGAPGKTEVKFFTREGQNVVSSKKHFREGNEFKRLLNQASNDVARENALFLTTIKSVYGGLSKALVDYLSSLIIIPGLSDPRLFITAGNSLDDHAKKIKIISLLKIADAGISDIRTFEFDPETLPREAPTDLIQDIKNGKKINTIVSEHILFSNENKPVGKMIFDFSHQESEGTRKMFEISPFIIRAIDNVTPLIMDEFDARFHPIITKRIVELFQVPENGRTQFIFATHDTNLLNNKLLRRDQICFVEKDKFGGSHLYNLAEIKGIRNDASYEKDYISGKYGAIPFVGDLNSLLFD